MAKQFSLEDVRGVQVFTPGGAVSCGGCDAPRYFALEQGTPPEWSQADCQAVIDDIRTEYGVNSWYVVKLINNCGLVGRALQRLQLPEGTNHAT